MLALATFVPLIIDIIAIALGKWISVEVAVMVLSFEKPIPLPYLLIAGGNRRTKNRTGRKASEELQGC